MSAAGNLIFLILIGFVVAFYVLLFRWQLDVVRRHGLPGVMIFVPGLVIALVVFDLLRDLRSAVSGARRDARRRR